MLWHRLHFRLPLLIVTTVLAVGMAAAQPAVPLTASGTTVAASTALLPLFGSTPGSCELGTIAEPYIAFPFTVAQGGPYAAVVVEPIAVIADTDDTVLLIYDGSFTPASACDQFVGVGNDPVGNGLAQTLTPGTYVLVVAGFLGTEDAFEVVVDRAPSLTVTPVDALRGDPIPSPVAVPSGGGTVYYSGTGTNVFSTAIHTEVWTSVELPSGSVITQNDASPVRIKANGSRMFARSLNINSGLPPGTYTVTMYLGIHPSGVVAQASFEVVKAAVRRGQPALTEEQILAMGFDALFGDEAASVDAAPDGDLPAATVLGQGYPNPFNPTATVPFTLAQDGDVRLAVYDLLGREVAVLAQGRMAAGSHTAVFDAGQLSSGTYLVRFTSAGRVQTQRLTLLK